MGGVWNMERSHKAIATIGLCAALPIMFSIPGLTAYPLTLIGGIFAGIAYVNIPTKELYDPGYRNRAKACSC